jgi:hypothetical protein
MHSPNLELASTLPAVRSSSLAVPRLGWLALCVAVASYSIGSARLAAGAGQSPKSSYRT